MLVYYYKFENEWRKSYCKPEEDGSNVNWSDVVTVDEVKTETDNANIDMYKLPNGHCFCVNADDLDMGCVNGMQADGNCGIVEE